MAATPPVPFQPFAALNPPGTDIQPNQIYGVVPNRRYLARAATFSRAQSAQQLTDNQGLDPAELNGDQAAQLAQSAKQIEQASLQRSKDLADYQQKIQSSALIEGLNALTYHVSKGTMSEADAAKNRTALLAQYPQGAQSPEAQQFFKEHKDAADLRQQLQQDHDIAQAGFTGQAKDKFVDAYKASNGDTKYATAIAKNEADSVKRAKAIASNPLVDPTVRAKAFDAGSNQFNTDPSFLDQGEVAAGVAKQKAAKVVNPFTAAGHIDTALKGLKDVELGKTPEEIAALSPEDLARYNTKYNLTKAQEHLSAAQQNASANLANTPPAVASGAPAAPTDAAVSSIAQQYLGISTPAPGATPAPVDASTPPPTATPAATPPAQPTPPPVPAAVPTATPPSVADDPNAGEDDDPNA